MNTAPKIALITGGSRGLGRNAALHVAANGGDVIITYRSNHAEADAVVAQIEKSGRKAVALMKGAIEVLSRYQAQELGARGIAVNVVAPGAIETDFGGGAVRDNAQLNAQIASQTALGRVGLPDDIGGVIASLLSPANSWINGQRIEVAGGIYL